MITVNVENRGSTGCYFRADTIGERHGLGLGCFLSLIVLPLRYTYRKNDRDKRGNEPRQGM